MKLTKGKKWGLGVAAAVTVLAIAGGGDGDKSEHTAATETTEATTTTEATETTEATTTTSNLGADMAIWASGIVGVTSEFQATFGAIHEAANNYDVVAMMAACGELDSLVDDARAKGTAPDPAVDRHWQEALGYFDEAAEMCVDGVINGDSDLLTLSAEAMTAGTEAIEAANKALREYL